MLLQGCDDSALLLTFRDKPPKTVRKTRHFMHSKTTHRLVPKLWESLPGYTHQRFVADLIAGVTVGLVALPLAMAFAISSGVTPQAGIYPAIIAGVVVSAVGGSRCQ